MSARASALILVVLIIVSAALTQVPAMFKTPFIVSRIEPSPSSGGPSASEFSPFFAFQAGVVTSASNGPRGPSRDWNVLDPEVKAAAALLYSLDDNTILLAARTYARWPMASLTKLMTAVVVAEDLGYHMKIVMSETAINTEGNNVTFNPGEEFSARDLVRIMVMTSSNDAAVALEEHAGGRDAFVTRGAAKAAAIGLGQTSFADAAGFSRANESSASDLVKLMKYIATAHPEILEWTRRESFLFQPTNDPTSRIATNVNPFASDVRFLGGKTGTLPVAQENLAGIFTVKGRRVAVVVLGSVDRVREVNDLLEWVRKAYIW